MNILIFGDSLTFGKWDEEAGWPYRLKRDFNRKHLDRYGDDIASLSDPNLYQYIYPLGVDGDKTKDLLERIETEARVRTKRGSEHLFIFAIGINDSQYNEKSGEFRVPLDQFEKNIRELIGISRKFTDRIIFVGFTPVDEDMVSPLPQNSNKHYKNEYIEKYNGTLRDICREEDIDFIDIFGKFVNENYEKYLEDGGHLNSRGHERIAEIMKNFLRIKYDLPI
ncbi:MAG: SGNH/GDSL hydrolase family protein [Candidatus Aenigmatarchaeota archaeon]